MDGKTYEAAAAALFDPEGWPACKGEIHVNASDRSHLLALAAPYLHLTDAVGVTDEGGALVSCNEPFCRLLGFPQDQLLGRGVGTLLSPAGRAPLGKDLPVAVATFGSGGVYRSSPA